MSIDGISGLYSNPAALPGLRTPRAPGGTTGGSVVQRAGAAPDRVQAAAQESVPADPPPGTDPALWSVLTSQERAYFARVRTSGAVTYGPGRNSGPFSGAFLGGRLDVRV